jgi:hypothetical protein
VQLFLFCFHSFIEQESGNCVTNSESWKRKRF